MTSPFRESDLASLHSRPGQLHAAHTETGSVLGRRIWPPTSQDESVGALRMWPVVQTHTGLPFATTSLPALASTRTSLPSATWQPSKASRSLARARAAGSASSVSRHGPGRRPGRRGAPQLLAWGWWERLMDDCDRRLLHGHGALASRRSPTELSLADAPDPERQCPVLVAGRGTSWTE